MMNKLLLIILRIKQKSICEYMIVSMKLGNLFQQPIRCILVELFVCPTVLTNKTALFNHLPPCQLLDQISEDLKEHN